VLTYYCIIYLQAVHVCLLPTTIQIHYSAWVILRREYPGVIIEVDENGDEFKCQLSIGLIIFIKILVLRE
jgi:hypothetical protein